MFLFSKKFLSLLLVVALMFGGERHSAEGLEKCWKCWGDAASLSSPECANDHGGEPANCYSDAGHACAMIKVGGVISKMCEGDPSKWSDNGQKDGNPICIKNEKCYCNDKDLCNQDKNFGLEDGTGMGGSTGGTGGGNGGVTTDKSGAVGTGGVFPAGSFLFWMMATVAVTLAPSICIPTI